MEENLEKRPPAATAPCVRSNPARRLGNSPRGEQTGPDWSQIAGGLPRKEKEKLIAPQTSWSRPIRRPKTHTLHQFFFRVHFLKPTSIPTQICTTQE